MRNKFTAVKTAKRRTKSSTAWIKRQINDPFVKKAQEEGWRSRAAFKIIEIEDKFKIFKKNKIVVDLGAAPGGWSQVAVEKVGKGRVFAIDLLPMDEIEGVEFLQQDFLKPDAAEKIIASINQHHPGHKCDIVLSDMATNSCGDARTDHLRIVGLLEEALDFACQVLQKDGVFVGKIFQGGAGGELLAKFKEYFTSVKHFKPDSSRKESAENYIVALGFKG
jgi:23S rRNA (uridine2552-2'-O)-methyltransferase